MNGDYQLAQQFFIFGSFRLIIRIMRWFGAVTHCVMNLKEVRHLFYPIVISFHLSIIFGMLLM